MKVDYIKAGVGIVGALFGIYNLAATHFGWPAITFNSDALTASVTTIWTLGFTAYTAWKNLNITPLARELQSFKDAVKNKDLDTMQKALDTFGELKDEVQKSLEAGE